MESSFSNEWDLEIKLSLTLKLFRLFSLPTLLLSFLRSLWIVLIFILVISLSDTSSSNFGILNVLEDSLTTLLASLDWDSFLFLSLCLSSLVDWFSTLNSGELPWSLWEWDLSFLCLWRCLLECFFFFFFLEELLLCNSSAEIKTTIIWGLTYLLF